MARYQARSFLSRLSWTCRQCQSRKANTQLPIQNHIDRRSMSSSKSYSADVQIQAAPEVNLEAQPSMTPARILPASPSYFTASPIFNDNILHLQTLVRRHESLPTVPPDQTPRIAWMRLGQYRSEVGETISASKYSKLLGLLSRLNRIRPQLRPKDVVKIMRRFKRPGSDEAPKAKVGTIDEHGRSTGVGRRKESSAKVFLVEGTGEVLVNGRNLVQVFPRLHDRESALWALKITERMDKYNVFALVTGGGVTGQAESITLAVAKALLVHEPALKPALRRAGCVTSDARRVERKKQGRLKARKKPAWVKR